METWEPHHRRQSTTEKGLGTSAGTKRKGGCSQSAHLNLTYDITASAMDTEPEHTNTDSESDDEDDDKVKPHDPDQQLRPKLPIYHPGFALAEGVTKEVLGVFTSYITTALNEGYEDAEAKRLRDEIEESQKIRYQETIKLAVAGDTGAGKSALLNAILGVVNLNIEVNEARTTLKLGMLICAERRWWRMYLRHHRVSSISSRTRHSIRCRGRILRLDTLPHACHRFLSIVVRCKEEAKA